MTPAEVCEGLGVYELRNRTWHVQGTCALKGDGLYEGLDWLATSLNEMRASGYKYLCAPPPKRINVHASLYRKI